MPILSEPDEFVVYGKWLNETCYEKYSPGHCLLLQTYLTNNFISSFNLVMLENDKSVDRNIRVGDDHNNGDLSAEPTRAVENQIDTESQFSKINIKEVKEKDG